MRFRKTDGESGEILKAGDRFWMYPDDPGAAPVQIHGRDGKPLPATPVRYTAPFTPELAEMFLTKATARDKAGIEIACESMGLKSRQRTRVVRLLALMMFRGLIGDTAWELVGHHARRA